MGRPARGAEVVGQGEAGGQDMGGWHVEGEDGQDPLEGADGGGQGGVVDVLEVQPQEPASRSASSSGPRARRSAAWQAHAARSTWGRRSRIRMLPGRRGLVVAQSVIVSAAICQVRGGST
ncbi:hypothetical protein [Streptomyces sp. NPDC091278]|uniref:hypothetical protein n=1 Tax=Streptomyces sp. NPDC091278 TaxID=3155301 RepID=UPI00344DB1AC